MIEIKSKLAAGGTAAQAQVKLPFELRQKSRLHTKLMDGEEAWLMLPRGEILRGGDLLLAADGRLVAVVAETEDVLHVAGMNATELARCLSSRQSPCAGAGG